MWKLAQLRGEKLQKQAEADFSQRHIWQEYIKMANAHADKLEAKQSQVACIRQPVIDFILSEAGRPSSKAKALVWGAGVGIEADLLNRGGLSVLAVESAQLLARKAKEIKRRGLRMLYKRDLQSVIDTAQTWWLMWVGRTWQQVALGEEEKTLNSFVQQLAPGGIIYLEACVGEHNSQSWRRIGRYMHYDKTVLDGHIYNLSQHAGVTILRKWDLGKNIWGYLLLLPPDGKQQDNYNR